MKIFYAGARTNTAQKLEGKNILLSYAYNKDLCSHFKNESLIMDSGAFTFWKNGQAIDVKKYAEYTKENIDHFEHFIAPDVICGSEQENIFNLMQYVDIIQNQEKVMPVFHEGDTFDLLQEYISLGFKKIALGATVSRGKSCLTDWLDVVFKEFPPNENLVYHGLGMNQKKSFCITKRYLILLIQLLGFHLRNMVLMQTNTC